MSEEEKKAIKNMKVFARVHQDMTVVTAQEMDIVLKLVEKQQEQLQEKDKIIDTIIDEYEYNARINVKDFCEETMRKDRCIQDCKGCIIEYFTKKAREV